MKLDLTELFCKIDDFCQAFEYSIPTKTITNGKKQRKRSCGLSVSEMMTIVIAYHQVRFRDFKTFFLSCFQQLKKLFPKLVSYSRFVQLMPRITVQMIAFTLSLRGECTGISFVDSTPIRVCKNKRIARHRVFRNIAERGMSSMGWFYGFKLHLLTNEKGELLSFHLTAGNVDDRKPVPSLCEKVWGKLFGDKGYLSQPLTEILSKIHLKLITPVKKNMKPKPMNDEEKVLLRKRNIIETINDQLKNISNIEHSRHRSPNNFLINLLAGLSAYMLKPNKPSLTTYNSSQNIILA